MKEISTQNNTIAVDTNVLIYLHDNSDARKTKMLRRYWILILVGIIAFLLFLIQNYVTNDAIEGVFVTNYNLSKIVIAETPSSTDTLILSSDWKFKSNFYGDGKYNIIRGLGYTSIELHFEHEFGKGSAVLPVKHTPLGKTIIILNDDNELFYEKQRL